jgi:hypothetical protein
MTEGEWLTGTDPDRLLRFVRGKAGQRKLRLFGVACCRRLGDLLGDERCRGLLDIAELYADRLASRQELQRAEAEARDAQRSAAEFGAQARAEAWRPHRADAGAEERAHRYTAEAEAIRAATFLAQTRGLAQAMHETARLAARAQGLASAARQEPMSERLAQCGLVRDLFGNPFRPMSVEPAWQTREVVGLARTIYEERRFEDLPVLADALEEVGCTSASLLEHCRRGGAHVRGCWAVDQLLGWK